MSAKRSPQRRPKRARRARDVLEERAKRRFHGHPIATIAYYGPDDRRASKVAVGIVDHATEVATTVERWHSAEHDVRWDPEINEQIVAFIDRHGAKSVAITDGLIGCPHEEGIDYPEGEACPQCPFWAHRDRWTGEQID